MNTHKKRWAWCKICKRWGAYTYDEDKDLWVCDRCHEDEL